LFSKKHKEICIGLLALLFVVCANGNSAEETIKNQFATLQKAYFLKLDLRAPKKELQTIPAFAVKLRTLADKQRAELASNKNLTQRDKELAGLIFIYDAMLNMNIIIGINEGKLSLADFTPHETLLARAKYILAELKFAATLRPDDHRIDGWIVGATGIEEKLQTGHTSKATQAAILKTINARPSFNLWVAILMLHNEAPAAKQKLLQAAKNFVDAANHGKDPCTLHPQDCISTWKATYNFQGSLTELGDVFLQQAEYYLAKGDIEKSMELAGYADGTYAQLFKPQHIKQTKKWPDHDVLAIRKERLAKIHHRELAKESLIKMDQYQRVYECASCHGRVTDN
jgi:hypothetical protein